MVDLRFHYDDVLGGSLLCEYACIDGHVDSHNKYMLSCVGKDMNSHPLYIEAYNLADLGRLIKGC